jgi:NAD(P)-dependent dehydrogenase (short-subunit alcohol dehydrogenase family)
VKPFGIQVVIIEPGAIKTEFQEVALGTLEKASGEPAYQKMAASFVRLFENGNRNAPGPELIARMIASAIHARRPRTRYALPNDSRMFILLRRLLSDRLFDRMLSTMIRA